MRLVQEGAKSDVRAQWLISTQAWMLKIEILTDGYADETSWQLQHVDGDAGCDLALSGAVRR